MLAGFLQGARHGMLPAVCSLGASWPPGLPAAPSIHHPASSQQIIPSLNAPTCRHTTFCAGTLTPMFGVIVAVVTSNAVAVLLGTEGVYESELELEVRVNYLAQVGCCSGRAAQPAPASNLNLTTACLSRRALEMQLQLLVCSGWLLLLPCLPPPLQEPPHVLVPLVAEQLMSTPVVGLPMVVPVSLAESLLRYSQHHGFPVYDPLHREPASGACRLDGFVLRSQIELLLHHRAYCDKDGRYLHLGQPADVDGFEEALAGAMAARLRHHPSDGPLLGLGAGGGGQGLLLATSSSSSNLRPSPFDNQVSVCLCAWVACFSSVACLLSHPFLNCAPLCLPPRLPAGRHTPHQPRPVPQPGAHDCPPGHSCHPRARHVCQPVPQVGGGARPTAACWS